MTSQEKHRSYTIAHFKAWAPVYFLIEIFVGKIRRRVVDMIGSNPKKVLDVACGPGQQTYAIAKAGHSVVGIDLSPDMLAYAKRDGGLNLKYMEEDATSMKFSDSQFDVSTISFALHDMPENLVANVLVEMKRITKNEGQIIIVDYNQPHNFVSTVVLGLSKLWETQYYKHFIKSGVDKYLSEARMTPKSKKSYIFGNVQIIEVVNTK